MIQERVEIYGEESGGRRFTLPLLVQYNPKSTHIEHAIIQTLKGRGQTFEELATEKGWRGAYWTYPSRIHYA